MCMTAAINYDVSAFVRLDGNVIKSQDYLKILGFRLGRKGDMTEQVKSIKRAFAANIWILRHL